MRISAAIIFLTLMSFTPAQSEDVNRAAKGDPILKEITAALPSPERHHFLVTVHEKIPGSNDCLQGDSRRREKAAEYCLDPSHGGKYKSGTYVQHQIGNPRFIPQNFPAGYNNARCAPRRNEKNERIGGLEMTQTFLVKCDLKAAEVSSPQKPLLLNPSVPLLPSGTFQRQ